MLAIMLSSTNMEVLVGPWLLLALTPLFIMSTVACTMRWGHFSVSLGIFMRSTIALYLCTIVGSYREDYRCSESLHWDYANASKLCGLTLAPKNEPMCMQRVWPMECP